MDSDKWKLCAVEKVGRGKAFQRCGRECLRDKDEMMHQLRFYGPNKMASMLGRELSLTSVVCSHELTFADVLVAYKGGALKTVPAKLSIFF